MTPKWIFFDLDDTLFDFSKASLLSLQKLWDETSEIRERFDNLNAFLENYHTNNKHMWELHESGKITADFLKGERFRLTIAPDRNDFEIQKFSRNLNDRYLRHLGECNAPMEGAKELLQYISRKRLIGILTNGFTEVQYRKIQTTGLDRYIQRMIISDEIGIQKPDSRLFRHAEQATGATPQSTIMVGDNPDNDMQGALNAGWHAIYFNRKQKPFASASHHFLGQIDSFKDIPDPILESL
ncbi:MAG: YjjG family noncanonical pyrimidine nucleotidase [Muribaculaceae bacterium]|nr:YjjG family noncanonical pyrimidine nucleotidase [Muribaculaceae bacterium]